MHHEGGYDKPGTEDQEDQRYAGRQIEATNPDKGKKHNDSEYNEEHSAGKRGPRDPKHLDSVEGLVIPVYSSIVIVGKGLRPLSSDAVVRVALLEVSRVHVLLDLSEHKDPLVGGRMGHEELGCFPPVGL